MMQSRSMNFLYREESRKQTAVDGSLPRPPLATTSKECSSWVKLEVR